jgi:hypothetical protein
LKFTCNCNNASKCTVGAYLGQPDRLGPISWE